MKHQALICSYRSNTALPYTWRQELGELDLVIPVPKGTRAKDLSIVITKKKLSVGLKGKDKILDGELCHEVKLDDSTWTLRKCSRQKSFVPHLTWLLLQRTKKPFIFISKSWINSSGGRTSSRIILKSTSEKSNQRTVSSATLTAKQGLIDYYTF